MTVESVYSVYVFIYRNLLIGPNPRCTPHSVTFTQDMSIDSVRGEGGSFATLPGMDAPVAHGMEGGVEFFLPKK